MKKVIAALLLMVLCVSLCACNQGDKVTIYVPEKETFYETENGNETSVQYLLYETGWESKESFVVRYSTDGKTPDANGKMIKYADKHISTVDEIEQNEEYTDLYGNVVSQSVLQRQTNLLTQHLRTFDKYGRILTQTTSAGLLGGTESYYPQVAFTITETEQGSQSAGTQHGVTETFVYDKDYRLVSYSKSFFGTEEIRQEFTYDKHGNMTSVTDYYEGVFGGRTVITYKAIKVSAATAQNMPWFKKDK